VNFSNHTPTREGLLLCIVGPAGCGKTTVCDLLVSRFPEDLRVAVTSTSRAPRVGEVDGVSYYFYSRDEFSKMIDEGAFFEWEETHGNLYGTQNRTLNEARASGVDLILNVDIRGALTFKRRLPHNTVISFLVPPTAAELERRIRSRGKASEEEIRTRLATAEREYVTLREYAEEIDYFVVNEHLEDTLSTFTSILTAERTKLKRLQRSYWEEICTL